MDMMRAQIFGQQRERLRMNFISDIGAGRTSTGGAKFRGEQIALPRVVFENEPFRIGQGFAVNCGQRVIVTAQIVKRTDEIEWRGDIRHTPDAMFGRLGAEKVKSETEAVRGDLRETRAQRPDTPTAMQPGRCQCSRPAIGALTRSMKTMSERILELLDFIAAFLQ